MAMQTAPRNTLDPVRAQLKLRARSGNTIGGQWKTPTKRQYFTDASPTTSDRQPQAAPGSAERARRGPEGGRVVSAWTEPPRDCPMCGKEMGWETDNYDTPAGRYWVYYFCPNPDCPYRGEYSHPAEIQDRATSYCPPDRGI